MPKEPFTNSLSSIFSSKNEWENLIEDKNFVSVFLSEVLEDYIIRQRWYAGKSSKLKY